MHIHWLNEGLILAPDSPEEHAALTLLVESVKGFGAPKGDADHAPQMLALHASAGVHPLSATIAIPETISIRGAHPE